MNFFLHFVEGGEDLGCGKMPHFHPLHILSHQGRGKKAKTSSSQNVFIEEDVRSYETGDKLCGSGV
jgi:hypothetical protein